MDPRLPFVATGIKSDAPRRRTTHHKTPFITLCAPGMRPRPNVTSGLLMAFALLGAGILASRSAGTTLASEGSEGGVSGSGCEVIEVQHIVGMCPPIQGPQRDDPWLPTVELPAMDGDLAEDCGAISVTISHIRLIDCPTDSGPFDQPILRFEGEPGSVLHVPAPAPDYSGYDALPIMICFLPSELPEILYIKHPDHSRRIGTARATIHCCESCS